MRVLILSLSLLLLAADTPEKDAAKKESAALQGTWSAVGVEKDGRRAPEDVVKQFKVVITGDQIIFNPDGENRTSRFVLDPSKKPKAMDVTPEQGPKKGVSLPAIYDLEGDTLKFCFGNAVGSDKRPTEFKTTPGSGLDLLVLKREKK